MADAGLALVTGGAGFIGSHLVELLLGAGYRVRVLDNFVNGKRENLATVPNANRLEIVSGDVTSREQIFAAMKGVTAVYHLAALGVRHSLHSPEENERVNAYGALLLLMAAREHGVPRFVHCSTSEIYGTARTVPMTEDHPAYPHTVYGAAKLAGEGYARAYHDSFELATVVVRPFNSYGPRSHHEGDSGEVIPHFVLRGLCRRPLIIFGDGTQTRDFTFVTDTALGLFLAGHTDAAVGDTFNVGSNMEISLNELARVVAEAVGAPDLEVIHQAPRPGDTLRLYADSSKSERVLGFRPSVSLREGIARLVAWYRTQPTPPETLLEQERVRSWEQGAAAR
jgi:UDP-glucose 4-epimerase